MQDQPAAALTRLADSGRTVLDPAQDVRGYQVRDRTGEDLGKVDDLLIDAGRGTVQMLRVEHGGILGLGATPSLVPVEAITRIIDGEVHIDQTRDRVVEAPRYDPELTDVGEQAGYYAGLYGHYGFSPFSVPGYAYPDFARYRADAPRER